jgi:hypothetical protein
VSELRQALEELMQDRMNHSSPYPGDYVIQPTEIRDLLTAYPVEPAPEAYEEYGVRYTSGPRKGSTPRRFRDLAQAVEHVAKGSDEMVVLHRVVTKWTEVEL